MTTVARRIVRSSPHRDAHTTWVAIVDLLTSGKAGHSARAELLAVAGTAASVVSDQAPKDVPIVVTCDGPRTRIYCLYDDDALDGSGAEEDSLGFDPLKGEWFVSLPCPVDDLTWVQSSLKAHSTRITARGPEEAVAADERTTDGQTEALVLNAKRFLGP